MLGWTDPEVDSDLLPSVTSSPKGRPGRCLSMACQSIYKSTDTNDNHQHHSKPALRISLYYLFRYLNMILMNRVSHTTTRHIFLRHQYEETIQVLRTLTEAVYPCDDVFRPERPQQEARARRASRALGGVPAGRRRRRPSGTEESRIAISSFFGSSTVIVLTPSCLGIVVSCQRIFNL